jgi:chemotaxis protein CheD
VRIAHHAVERGQGRLVTIGLGSCVAIMVHDRAAKVGGMAHVLLPEAPLGRGVENRAKYATTAVPLLVESVRARGGGGPLVAKLAGGAAFFGPLLGAGRRMGERNVEAARAALAAAGIPLVAEDVGGSCGRTVIFDIASGALTVRTVARANRVL